MWYFMKSCVSVCLIYPRQFHQITWKWKDDFFFLNFCTTVKYHKIKVWLNFLQNTDVVLELDHFSILLFYRTTKCLRSYNVMAQPSSGALSYHAITLVVVDQLFWNFDMILLTTKVQFHFVAPIIFLDKRDEKG